MKNLPIILFTLLIFSCSPPESESDLCIDKMIDELDMEHYTGEMSSECQTYLNWFTYDGSDYFMLSNPCADMLLHLFDCEHVDVCVDFSSQCQEIMSNMTSHGIVAKNTD